VRTNIALLSAVTLVSGAGSVYGSDAPVPSQASAPAVQYRVSNLPTLGGAAGTGSSINDLNWVTGFSTLAGNQSQHAALWLHGTAFDLGTLGGANSSVLWPVKNDIGLVAGIAQTSTPDPLK
jgi:probable HAF family extracellular repeat protein